MPVIFVWNALGPSPDDERDTPRSTARRRQKDQLSESLIKAVLSIPELAGVAKNDILIVYPESSATPSDLTLISVDVLFEKKDRTREMRERLAEALKKAALAWHDATGGIGANRVEVAVRRFDTEADVYI